MAHAPFSPASSAGGPVVETRHACARHPQLTGDRICSSCSNALCTACARSLAHRTCPSCREAKGEAAHVVDASWRVQLLLDSLGQSWRAIPRRVPAMGAILAVSMLAPLGIYTLADPADPDWTDGAALAAFFGLFAYALGMWLQPLIVIPMHERSSKVRALAGAFLGALVAFVPPLLMMGVIGATAEAFSNDVAEVFTTLMTFGLLLVGFVSLPLGLTWQGRAVMDRGPSLRGMWGAAIAHFVVVGIWSMVLSMAWIPLIAVVVAGFAAGGVVAGVLGTISGLLIWVVLLLGMGSFAAASARYSDDLDKLC